MSLFPGGEYFTPVTGERYRNINSEVYECRVGLIDGEFDDYSAWFVSPRGWAFKAIGCQRYPDGLIEWDYSKHGHWIDQKQFPGA